LTNHAFVFTTYLQPRLRSSNKGQALKGAW